ncbi:hypothetical protein GCM10022279_07650 [Comamonas faecalis]|uniref:GlsB/YeaQ/YmgE family stress response membrane protein n=1 Tax=Comamonas faecalis TaxID=1387849 RepID=A0ABP7QS11_9BURK
MLVLFGPLVIGMMAGLLTCALKAQHDALSRAMACLLGICGAFAATFFGQLFGWYQPSDAASWGAAALGAAALLLIFALSWRSRAP